MTEKEFLETIIGETIGGATHRMAAQIALDLAKKAGAKFDPEPPTLPEHLAGAKASESETQDIVNGKVR